MMRFRTLMMAGLLAGGFGLVACTAEVEDPGEAPSVDVDPGQMPSVDVDPAQVDISADTQQIVTPDIDVTSTDDDTAAADTAM